MFSLSEKKVSKQIKMKELKIFACSERDERKDGWMEVEKLFTDKFEHFFIWIIE